jgi:hypothetical protein
MISNLTGAAWATVERTVCMKVGIIAELSMRAALLPDVRAPVDSRVFDGAQHDYRLIRRRPGYDAGVREEPYRRFSAAPSQATAMPLVLLPWGYDPHDPTTSRRTSIRRRTRVMTMATSRRCCFQRIARRTSSGTGCSSRAWRVAATNIVTFRLSKRDIVRLLGVGPENVTVTHLAADERFPR